MGNDQFTIEIERGLNVIFPELKEFGEKWISNYFPRDTGEMADVTGKSIKKVGDDAINVDGSSVEHAKYVEDMSGVNWTNPNTVEHPFASLEEAMTIKAGELITEQLLKMSGLKIKVLGKEVTKKAEPSPGNRHFGDITIQHDDLVENFFNFDWSDPNNDGFSILERIIRGGNQ